MKILRSTDVPAYVAPTVEAVAISVENGFANSFPEGDVEPMSMDYVWITNPEVE